MAIKTETGVTLSKALARQVITWGKKGIDVSNCRDAEEMLHKSRLDWHVVLQDVKTSNGTPTPWKQSVKIDPDGTQTPLSIVPTKNWKPLSNHNFLNRAINVAESFGGSVSRVGWLKKDTAAVNQQSFLWATISPGDLATELAIDKYGGEGITPNILLTSGTSYGCGYSCKMLLVRNCCQNGMVDRQSTSLKSTHQTNLAFENFTFEQVRDSINLYKIERDLLLNTQIAADRVYTMFIHRFGHEAKLDQPIKNQPRKVQLLWDIYNGEADRTFEEVGIDLGQARIRGTYYGVLQSVIAYNNHFGDSSGDNKMIDIINAERGKEIDKIRASLTAAASKRTQETVSVGLRAW